MNLELRDGASRSRPLSWDDLSDLAMRLTQQFAEMRAHAAMDDPALAELEAEFAVASEHGDVGTMAELVEQLRGVCERAEGEKSLEWKRN